MLSRIGLEVGRLDALAALAAGEAQILLDQLGHLADVLAQARPAPGRRPRPAARARAASGSAGVRRSWLTAASISVRWLMWRRMRWRIRLKAWAAWRISKRTARPEVADVAALAEAVGGAGELADRADLQAQEVDRDRRAARSSCRPSRPSSSQVVVLVTRFRAATHLAAGRARSGRRRRPGRDRRSRRSTANG